MNDQPIMARAPDSAGYEEDTHVEWSPAGVIASVGISLAILGLVFGVEIESAVHTWLHSTAYNHCFLVIPIAIWLAWDRKELLEGLYPMPIPAAALLTIPLGVIWLASERLGLMEGRQLVFITVVEVLCLTLLGWRLYRALLGPLLYLYFLVPFGEFLTPKLQDVTTWFTRVGLDLLGVPAYIDGYVIEIKEGTFFVAEACAGLRFLIASIAFGVLYALMMYRSPIRRWAFVIASVIVPIVANGIRAMGIVWLGHILGNAEAVEADHVLYGWVFFSVVFLLLIAIGLPFREDHLPAPAAEDPADDDEFEQDHEPGPDPRMNQYALFAGLGVAMLAAIGPGVALALGGMATMAGKPAPVLAIGPGCSPAALDYAVPMPPNPVTRVSLQVLSCDGVKLTVLTEVFSPHVTAAPIAAERRRLTRIPDADDISEGPVLSDDGRIALGWRMIRTNQPSAVSAIGIWVDGQHASLGLAARSRLALTSIRGAANAPVLISVVPQMDWASSNPDKRDKLERALAAFIFAHPEIDTGAKAIAAAAGH